MNTTTTIYQQRANATKARRAEVYARRRREAKAWALYWKDYAAYRSGLGAQPDQGDYFTLDSNGWPDASEWAVSRFGELKKAA